MKLPYKILVFITLAVIFVSYADYSYAAKTLPRFSAKAPIKKNTVSVPSKSAASRYILPKLRSDRRALLVDFKNLREVKMIEYVLTYNTNGSVQGVTGTIDSPTEKSLSRELVFGTESKGVFTYHTNITGMKFEVTISLTSGKKIIKRYIIKV